METQKKEWGLENDDLYNPQHTVTYNLYVKNTGRTLSALLSQQTIKPVRINLTQGRRNIQKYQMMVTTIH